MVQDDYGVVSDEILYDIAYAINVNAPNFGSTQWLTKRMQELGKFNAKQKNRIYNVAYSNDLTTLAWKTLRDIEHEFPQTKGIIPRDERVRLTVRAVANQTSQYFGALNATMLRSADQLYQTALTEVERRMLLATESVMTGMATKMSVTKQVIDLVQKIGVTGFVDKAGRKWSAEAYADLVTRSSMGNIQRQIMVDRCHDYGEDIVYAPIKFPSRPLCADWQGKLLSLSNQHYFTNDLYDRPMEVFPYSDAVGHPAGLWGCNCGHGHAVFIPSLSEVVKPVNQMTPEQNAEAYALTQQERQLERNVRNNKTKVKMLEKAGVTGDELDQAKNKLKQANNAYRGFLNKYGYDPTAGRTYVYGFSGSKGTGGGRPSGTNTRNGRNPASSSDTSATPTNKFVRAVSIAGAEEYARNKGFADRVDYGNLTLDQANTVNETLTDLTEKYPINKLDNIKRLNGTAQASANFQSLNINKAVGDNDTAQFLDNQEQRRKYIDAIKKSWGDNPMPKYVQKNYDELMSALKYTRFSVSDTYVGQEAKAVIAHEYGHIVADQYFGQINKKYANEHYRTNPALEQKRQEWINIFKKAKKNEDIYSVSKYGGSDSYEFFAECFSARYMGETLPDYVESFIGGILRNGIM